MRLLTKKYQTDLSIEIETKLNGMIVGDVVVKNAVIFVINGTIIGNLTIEKGSRAILYGMINGNINNFGTCEIYGMVKGELYDPNNKMFIDQNAKLIDKN